MQLSSPAFPEGGAIPERYTCEGMDRSPPLEWHAAPPETRSLALICDDPDAPRKVWVHWVLFNLPPGDSRLPEGAAEQGALPPGARHGRNDFGREGYGGPCPPTGTHRYSFRLYALDSPLSLPEGATRQEVERAMRGHVLAEARLTGTYRRSP